jgi:hypothetical protein
VECDAAEAAAGRGLGRDCGAEHAGHQVDSQRRFGKRPVIHRSLLTQRRAVSMVVSRLAHKAAHEFLYFRLTFGRLPQKFCSSDHPVRTACQTPVHAPDEDLAAQRPPPELPASRPVPRTYRSPWTTVTVTAPRGVTWPETPEISWETTRPPMTLMGNRNEGSQGPDWLVAVTLHLPSKLCRRAALADVSARSSPAHAISARAEVRKGSSLIGVFSGLRLLWYPFVDRL